MIVLGLGSNVGDRLHHLRRALEHIKHIPELSVECVSPVYISDALLPENSPASWDTPYLNLALRCETKLSPYELLDHTKKIEKKIGQRSSQHWGPRAVDIDLLAWDDLIQYDRKLHVPHEQLHARPFAFWPLADVAPQWVYPLPGPLHNKTAAEIVAQWGSRFTGEAPLHCKQIQHRIDTPQLVGIINVTPDSFSDGGKFLDPSAALSQCYSLIDDGADILDIGAESTRPHAASVDPNIEWQRLEPILTELLEKKSRFTVSPRISIDTRHPEIAKKALALGVDWINDVSGLDHSLMRELAANHACDVVFMHHLGIPVNKNNILPLNKIPTDIVYNWAEQRLHELEKAGIARERLIFDVGIGYGKTPAQSLELIKNINVFNRLGVRLLVGHSRKSFLSQFTDKPAVERDIETVVLSFHLAQQKVAYLRLHNVDIHARASKVAARLKF
jgi:2-amino-4-hydroxy-6-hydroxymethyldihydropteridine diphosphokinase/dihydropteroate synthase